MTKDTNIVDIVFHLHPATSCDDRSAMEQGLRACVGVISVRFERSDHPHAVVVVYDPQAVSAEQLLAEVRKCDKQAVMAGL